MNLFNKVSNVLANFEDWVMVIGMIIASFIITLQVILRYIFNYSISWGEELTRYTIVWMSFVGAGMGVRKGAHICVDTIAVFLPEKWKRGLTSFMAFVGMALGSAVFYAGITLVFRVYQGGQVSPAMEVPMYIAYIGVPLGGIILSFRFLELFINNIKGFFPKIEVERKGGM